MRYHARASATVNTTLALPFETSQQASRAVTIEGPTAHAVDHSRDLNPDIGYLLECLDNTIPCSMLG
jgi:hypothetical protein